MKAAIENFARMHENNKVLILGGMMELGAGSVDEHKAIIELIGRYHWNTVVLVGGDLEQQIILTYISKQPTPVWNGLGSKIFTTATFSSKVPEAYSWKKS
jgi:UDP-N-acetylmuramyl pentapeptide synthase